MRVYLCERVYLGKKESGNMRERVLVSGSVCVRERKFVSVSEIVI